MGRGGGEKGTHVIYAFGLILYAPTILGITYIVYYAQAQARFATAPKKFVTNKAARELRKRILESKRIS